MFNNNFTKIDQPNIKQYFLWLISIYNRSIQTLFGIALAKRL